MTFFAIILIEKLREIFNSMIEAPIPCIIIKSKQKFVTRFVFLDEKRRKRKLCHLTILFFCYFSQDYQFLAERSLKPNIQINKLVC